MPNLPKQFASDLYKRGRSPQQVVQAIAAYGKPLPAQIAAANPGAPAVINPVPEFAGPPAPGDFAYSKMSQYGLPTSQSISSPTGFGASSIGSLIPPNASAFDSNQILGSSQATPGFTAEFPAYSKEAFSGGLSDIGSIGDFSQWGKNNGLFDNIDSKGMKTQGMLGAGFGVAQGIGNAYFAMKNYGLAKDTFTENKRQYDQNYGMQKDLTYADLRDRQEGRHRNNPGTQASWEDYKKANLSQA